MRPLYPMLLFIVGCTPKQSEAPPIDVRVEATGVVDIRAVDPDDAVLSRPEGLFGLRDGRLDATVAPVVAAARFDTRIVATASELLVGDGGLLPSPLAAELPAPTTNLVAAGTALWIESDGYWWVYARGHLTAPQLDESPIVGEAVAGRVDGVPVVWVQLETGLVALADSIEGPVVVVRSELVADHLAASAEGLWASTSSRLHLFDGARWRRVGAAVDDLAGHPDSPGVWLLRDETVLHGVWNGNLKVREADVPGSWRGADASGRLWTLADDGTVRRAAATPTVRLTGLVPDRLLAEPLVVGVDVTHADTLTELAVAVDGDPVTLQTAEDGSRFIVLDPVLLSAGEHVASATAVWPDETTTSAPIAFSTVVTGPITWLDHVEPLYRANCAICHDNGTETILIGQDEWITLIEPILVEVEAGRMPIGSDPLDAATIGVIRSWQAAGFP